MINEGFVLVCWTCARAFGHKLDRVGVLFMMETDPCESTVMFIGGTILFFYHKS
ncbi:hypothetical protein PR003_g7443 [Phytophthora rubi]|uniref:Uncharacterized protein n=1 Tax=Phytophthora rubi TaxID=129364 RepID=A0A6A4FLU0_9STRA|nr:hypothetical protein PR002_g13486 [Phytophthora rubi]KAE9039913.1 hypothetical protein PR001_g7307 [Phytophthora rubi]KAE9346414.1 hypothetical protein PR003_g7443 [Phytophthora rubi]